MILTSTAKNESKFEGVKAEAASTSEDKVWSSIAHVMALEKVIFITNKIYKKLITHEILIKFAFSKRPIFSVAPNANLALRPLIT